MCEHSHDPRWREACRLTAMPEELCRPPLLSWDWRELTVMGMAIPTAAFYALKRGADVTLRLLPDGSVVWREPGKGD